MPFGPDTIPILGPEHLVVCKAVFNRPKDWLDIEQVLATVDGFDAADDDARSSSGSSGPTTSAPDSCATPSRGRTADESRNVRVGFPTEHEGVGVSQKPLGGQAALITGGGGGIGGASAAWLARDGAAVVIMGRTEATLAATKQHDPRVRRRRRDRRVLRRRRARRGRARAMRWTRPPSLADRLAIAVSVIGGGTMKPLVMFDGAEVLEELNRNVVSAFLVIRQATPHMATHGGGSIVCISSDAATIPWPFLTIYNTSKSGVEGLVRGAALELARSTSA